MTDAMKQRAVLNYFKRFFNATVVNPILGLLGDEKRDREQAQKSKERADQRQNELSDRQKEREARRNKLAAKRGYNVSSNTQTPKQQQQNLNMIRDPSGPGNSNDDDDDDSFVIKLIVGVLVAILVCGLLYAIIPSGDSSPEGIEEASSTGVAIEQDSAQEKSASISSSRRSFFRGRNKHKQSQNGQKLPRPPPSLSNICSTTYFAANGNYDCQVSCEVAECCDFSSDLQLSCFQDNQRTCQQYQKSCHILKDEQSSRPSKNIPPVPPKNIQEICGPGLETSHGHLFCKRVCKPAQCCFRDDGNATATATTNSNCPQDICEKYSSCKNLGDHINFDKDDDEKDGSRQRRTSTPTMMFPLGNDINNHAQWNAPFPSDGSGTAIAVNNDLKVFPWKYVTGKDGTDENDYYLGYLEFCSDGQDTFGYRAMSSPTSAASIHDCGTEPSPLIRMIPGQTYKLILINHAHVPTNLHTHGLHISGMGHADDITRTVDPGKCLTYQYHILDTADVGTFWYHSHQHPLATNQVQGGAYGMLIVDETKHTMMSYPPHVQQFFQNEINIQFSTFVDRSNNEQRINQVNHGRVSRRKVIDLIQDEYYYFRISAVTIVDPINYVEFKSSNCETRIIAYDGTYRSKIPHEKKKSNKYMLSSSSRIDLAVKCQSLQGDNESYIVFHQGQGVEKDSDDSIMEPLVTIRTSKRNDGVTTVASPFWNAETQTQWSPKRPYYLPDLSLVKEVDDVWDLHMQNKTIVQSDSISNGGVTKSDNTEVEVVVSMNHHTWDVENPIRTFQLNQLIELNLWNTQFHPFHIHINRMQIVEPGGCGSHYEEGEYYDTIAAAASTSLEGKQEKRDKCTVRMKFFDFAGRIVAHCHKLNHEDKGMMVWVDVKGGDEHDTIQGEAQEECMNIELTS